MSESDRGYEEETKWKETQEVWGRGPAPEWEGGGQIITRVVRASFTKKRLGRTFQGTRTVSAKVLRQEPGVFEEHQEEGRTAEKGSGGESRG